MGNDSLFEEAVEEYNRQLSMFDNIIFSDNEFNLNIAIMPDDFIIELYKYLIKLERRESFFNDDDSFNERLMTIKNRIVALERLDVIENYLSSLVPEDVKQEVAETVKISTEKKKVRRMGPIRKWIYNMNKKQK